MERWSLRICVAWGVQEQLASPVFSLFSACPARQWIQFMRQFLSLLGIFSMWLRASDPEVHSRTISRILSPSSPAVTCSMSWSLEEYRNLHGLGHVCFRTQRCLVRQRTQVHACCPRGSSGRDHRLCVRVAGNWNDYTGGGTSDRVSGCQWILGLLHLWNNTFLAFLGGFIGVLSRWSVTSSIRVSSDRAGRSLLLRRCSHLVLTSGGFRVKLSWVARRPLSRTVLIVVMMAGLRVLTSTWAPMQTWLFPSAFRACCASRRRPHPWCVLLKRLSTSSASSIASCWFAATFRRATIIYCTAKVSFRSAARRRRRELGELTQLSCTSGQKNSEPSSNDREVPPLQMSVGDFCWLDEASRWGCGCCADERVGSRGKHGRNRRTSIRWKICVTVMEQAHERQISPTILRRCPRTAEVNGWRAGGSSRNTMLRRWRWERRCATVSGMQATLISQWRIWVSRHQCHEVEVCRGKEVSEAKVILAWFFENRADIIWKVLARDRLVNIGILPSVNFTKHKRVAKPGISVCSRIMRLMNNQTKRQRKATIPTKEEKATTRVLWLLCKIVPQLGCVSQDSEALVSNRGKQPRGNTMQKVLGPIRRIRFTQSTLRQASIRERKGPLLGKIQVKNPH